MKKLIILTSILGCSVLIFSCNNTAKTDSKANADTLNNMKDSTVDSTRSITRDLKMTVSHDDARFAVEAANGGMAEVELGKLAQEKAGDQKVKDFGTMMVNDHSKANDQMKTLAAQKGITLPATIGENEQKLKGELSSKSGKDFDKAYIDAMIKDHQDDIKSFKSAISTLRDPDLKNFATNTLPTLKMHLAAIQKIKNEAKE